MQTLSPLALLLKNYQTSYPEESAFLERFSELLKHPRVFHRDHLPGHITGSAWTVNVHHNKVLLVHHAKLKKWLQPGGHADGNEDILQVALRELEEETGLQSVKLILPGIFDLDIHPIPVRKDFPDHFHYDVRFLFEADEQEPIMVSEESLDVRWVPLYELHSLTDNISIHRMAEKITGMVN